MGSIWTNQSCSARKDAVFMATPVGRACAPSAGERKTRKKSKNRFKRIGRLLRGLSVSSAPCLIRKMGNATCLVLFVSRFAHAYERCPSPGCRKRKRRPMQADISRPNCSPPSHPSASLRKEKQRKSPAKSTRSQSFLFLPAKQHQKKVHTIVNNQV